MENNILDSYSNIKSKIDPINALQYLRSLGRIWTVWPLDIEASRLKKIYHEISLWFIIVNLFFASITLWMSVCSCGKYPILMAKNLSQLMIINDSFSHLILYRLYRSDLSILVQDVFKYMEICKNHERTKIQEYFVRFFIIYISLIVMYIIAALAFFCGAFILKKDFPIDASYPFSTDSALMSTIIYTHQTFSIVQNATLIMIDFLVITLFWYSGARINILGYRLQMIQNADQLNLCIQEHQEIIRFIQYSVTAVQFIVFKTISIVAIIIISAGLQLIYYDAQIVGSQFSLIITVAILRMITYSSTIDEMKELNDNLRWKIYKSNWIQSISNTNKNVQIFIHRCQSPIVVLHGRMFNIISLKFLAKLIYTSVSHLTTLRAIIERYS
ncbi:uncharacterized protein LOC131668390 [Phymastichus coffea]|uniref:uncharacterized protein LOC131668390 n=1 Tax=Phymastichus coffea TaxID=108790 RepID=UPI00273C4F41|nr:uncharacterized protein LOC131668390 [Phymastichus coffea]